MTNNQTTSLLSQSYLSFYLQLHTVLIKYICCKDKPVDQTFRQPERMKQSWHS